MEGAAGEHEESPLHYSYLYILVTSMIIFRILKSCCFFPCEIGALAQIRVSSPGLEV